MKKILPLLAFGLIAAAVGAIAATQLPALTKSDATAAEKPIAEKMAADKSPESGETEATEEVPIENAFIPVQQPGSTYDVIAADPDLSTFMEALKSVDLQEALSSDDFITVFAPSNDAFAALPEGLLEGFLSQENSPILKNILSYHVIRGKILTPFLPQEQTRFASLQGSPVTIEQADEGIKFNEANLIIRDIQTTNGVIHVVDSVSIAIPEPIQQAPTLSDAPAGGEAAAEAGVAPATQEESRSEISADAEMPKEEMKEEAQ